jgi:hypothetical protein
MLRKLLNNNSMKLNKLNYQSAFKSISKSIRYYKVLSNDKEVWLIDDGLFTWQCNKISLQEDMTSALISGMDAKGRKFMEYPFPSLLIVETDNHIIIDSLH